MNLKTLIKEWLFERYEIPTFGSSISRLKASGFRPAVWLDVGAHHGEVASMFRKAWPDAKGFCLEGQAEPLKALRARFEGDATVEIIPKLAGAKPQERVILRGRETSASVLEEDVHPQSETQEAEMTTIDHELSRFPPVTGAFLVKIDTQGYELEILKGAENCLQKTEALILEVNFLEIHKGVPLADELVAWLKERGFLVYDIAGITRRPKNRSLWQADFVFVPANSPLRADKSYA